jgi:hypothetical protein
VQLLDVPVTRCSQLCNKASDQSQQYDETCALVHEVRPELRDGLPSRSPGSNAWFWAIFIYAFQPDTAVSVVSQVTIGFSV